MDSGPTTCNILNCEIMSRYLALISRVSICCSFHAVSIANHLSNSPVSICRVYANTVPGKFNDILNPKFIKIGEHPVSMWSWSLFLAGENFLTCNFCLRHLSTVHNCAFGWLNALIYLLPIRFCDNLPGPRLRQRRSMLCSQSSRAGLGSAVRRPRTWDRCPAVRLQHCSTAAPWGYGGRRERRGSSGL